MRLTTSDCRRLLATARVARLATSGTEGPHLVPIVFAAHNDRIVFAVDGKPKLSSNLTRLRNIERDPRVCVLVDHYDDDWTRLWWVRVDGIAEIHSSGSVFREAISQLVARYPPYRENPPPGPAVSITASAWTGWRASAEHGSLEDR